MAFGDGIIDSFYKGFQVGQLQKQNRLADEERLRKNKMRELFEAGYVPGTPGTPGVVGYGGEEYEPVEPVQAQAPSYNPQNAIAALYKGGFGPEAFEMESKVQQNELARLLATRPKLGEPKAGLLDGKETYFRADDRGGVYDLSGKAITGNLQPRPQQPLVENYGAPVSGVDEKGNPVFFQPGKRGGAPSVVPGVRPPKIPEAEKDRAAALRRLQSSRTKAEVVSNKIDEALSGVGFFTTGLPGKVLGMVPGTPAYDLDKAVDTVKANIGFQELQAMRESSPTGGALGSVAVKELDFLQSAIASLDTGQDRATLANNLQAVRTHFQNWKNAVEQAYMEQYGRLPPEAQSPSGAIGSPKQKLGDIVDGPDGKKYRIIRLNKDGDHEIAPVQ